MPFRPFPIYDPITGVTLAKEPWLTPERAFTDLSNMLVRNGRLVGRSGYRRVGILGTKVKHQVAVGDGVNTFMRSDTLGPIPCEQLHESLLDLEAPPSAYVIRFETIDSGDNPLVGEFHWEFDGPPSVIGNTSVVTGDIQDPGPTGPPVLYYGGQLFPSQNGSYLFYWTVAPKAGAPIYAIYEYRRGLPVMHLSSHQISTGDDVTIAIDTKRMWKWDAVQERFEPVGDPVSGQLYADLWSGEEDDFYDVEAVNDGTTDFLVINNAHEPPMKFTPTTGVLEEMAAEYDAGKDIESAGFFRWFNYYGVYLRPTEDGALRPYRARWTGVLTPEVFDSVDDWADAKVPQYMQAVSRIREDLIVLFERAVARLVVVDDVREIFRWTTIGQDEGCVAQKSVAAFDDRVYWLGLSGLLESNGERVVRVGKQFIPEFTKLIEPNFAQYSYAERVDEFDEVWMTIVPPGGTFPTRVMVFNRLNNSFSFLEMSMQSFGSLRRTSVPLWDQIQGNFDDIVFAPDEKVFRAGYPSLISGGRDGIVYEQNIPGGDSSLDAQWEGVEVFNSREHYARSGRLNPYARGENPRAVEIGKIEIHGTAMPGEHVHLRLRRNHDDSVYKEIAVDMTPESPQLDRVWRIVEFYERADFWQLELHYAGIGRLEIDAIVPWMREAGPMEHA